jgi:hypothetical protein
MRIAAVGFSVLAAAATVVSIAAGRRADTLKAAEDAKMRRQLEEASESARQAKRQLEEEQETKRKAEELRRIPPLLDAFLEPQGRGRVQVRIVSKNLIPFEYKYFIQRKDGTLLTTSFPLDSANLFPTGGQNIFAETRAIQPSPDGYLELRVEFKSLSKDLHNLPGHTGSIVKRYGTSADGSSLTALP